MAGFAGFGDPISVPYYPLMRIMAVDACECSTMFGSHKFIPLLMMPDKATASVDRTLIIPVMTGSAKEVYVIPFRIWCLDIVTNLKTTYGVVLMGKFIDLVNI